MMPEKKRNKWHRPFSWPPSTWEFTWGLQKAADIVTAWVFLLIIITCVGALTIWPVLIYRTVDTAVFGNEDSLRNVILAIAALIGVPFLIWRTLILSKQTEISRESHYTDLFTKAVEQLGADKTLKKREFKPKYVVDTDTGKLVFENGKRKVLLSEGGEPLGEYHNYEVTVTNFEVRLGAIYALERIAQDSVRDSKPIYLTLCSYLQNNCEEALVSLQNYKQTSKVSDLFQIIDVIGRYAERNDDVPQFHFTNIHLPNFQTTEAVYRSLTFRDCSQETVEYHSHVSEISFFDCLVGHIEFAHRSCDGVSFVGGVIERLRFMSAQACNFDLSSKYDSFVVLNCTFKDSGIRLGEGNFFCRDSQWEDIRFYTRPQDRFALKEFNASNAVFNKCSFYGCDFSFRDLSNAVFTNCSFKDCNLVNSLVTLQDCIFDSCFTDKNVDNEKISEGWALINKCWIEFLQPKPKVARPSLGVSHKV